MQQKNIYRYAVTGTFHGSIIYAETEGMAKKVFHSHYNGESILSVIGPAKYKKKRIRATNLHYCHYCGIYTKHPNSECYRNPNY